MDDIDIIGSEWQPKKKKPAPDSHTLSDNASVPNESAKVYDGKSVIGDKRRWGASGDIFHGLTSTYETLPPSLYKCAAYPNIGAVLERRKVDTDDLIRFPDSDIDYVIKEFQRFWSEEITNRFRDRGFLHKRGILLWGPPGSGKTSCIQLLIKMVINDHNGIAVLIDDPDVASACLAMTRNIEPDRPIIGIIEDLDAQVDRYDENDYLSLLDGEDQVDNIIFVATSNYPQRLDPRFKDRPSRFDLIKMIKMPNKASRRLYLETKEPSFKLPENKDELEKWVDAGYGLSIAHLKEMIISVKCFGDDFDLTIDRLKKMREKEIDSKMYEDGGKKSIGFATADKGGFVDD